VPETARPAVGSSYLLSATGCGHYNRFVQIEAFSRKRGMASTGASGDPVASSSQATGELPAAPMVFGVAGHRDLHADDRDALRQKLGELFRQFKSAYPHSPLVLLSSLAEGADQLAAEVALENGVLVRAPLPFPQDAFRESTSFSSEEGRISLDKLLGDPRVEAFVVPLPEGTLAGTDWHTVATDSIDPRMRDLRRVCYANAGGYVVRHSLAFVALWDGAAGDPARPSGTAEYVVFKLQGRAPAQYPWTNAEPLGFRGERGPVYAIHTPRANPREPKAPTPAAASAEILVPSRNRPFEAMVPPRPLPRRITGWTRWHRSIAALLAWIFAPVLWVYQRLRLALGGKPASSREAEAELWQFQETCQALDDFNRDVRHAADSAGLRRRLDQAVHGLPADLAPTSAGARGLHRLSAVRDAASHLANKLKPKVDAVQLAIIGLLGLGAFFFHYYAHWFPFDVALVDDAPRPVWLGLFLGSLFATWLVVCIGHGRRWNERRLDYRALAEALRVRRAWAIAGIGASVADSYLGQLRSEMSWVRRALMHLCPPPATWAEQFAALHEVQKRQRLENVRETWVKGQIKQFARSHHREERIASRLQCAGYLLALLGWLWIPLLFGATYVVDKTATLAHPEECWLIASGILVVGGGLCIAFRERGSHDELANQYERMRVVFESGLTELERRLGADDLTGAQAVLQALGREAIAEHAQWLILRRARPLELHVG
jgi:hypothetical protein